MFWFHLLSSFLTENLCRQWQDIEATYLQKLKEVFSNLWVEQQETQKALKEVGILRPNLKCRFIL